MKNKLTLLGLFVLLSFSLSSAVFAANESNFKRIYFGAGIGPNYTSSSGEYIAGVTALGFVGYNFSSHWAAEYAYIYTSVFSQESQPEYRLISDSVAAQYSHNISRRLILSGQLGVASVEQTEVHEHDYIPSPNISKIGVLPMVGAKLTLYWNQYLSNGVRINYLVPDSGWRGVLTTNITLAVHFNAI